MKHLGGWLILTAIAYYVLTVFLNSVTGFICSLGFLFSQIKEFLCWFWTAAVQPVLPIFGAMVIGFIIMSIIDSRQDYRE